MGKVKEFRENRGLRQDDMAAILEVSPATYCKKENGAIKFSLPEAKKLADFFNTTIEAIFFTNEVSEIETN